MNRAERRAIQFGHFSPNRGYYQVGGVAQGIEKEMDDAFWEDEMREIFRHIPRLPDPRFKSFGTKSDYFENI